MINANKAVESVSTAMLNLAKEENKIQEFQTDLSNLKNYMKQDDGLARFLRQSNISKKEKLDELFSLHELFSFDKTLNMIAILVEANASYLLKDVINTCLYDLDEELGIVHLKIYAPFDLSVEQIAQIEQAILLRKDLLPNNFSKIESEFHLDPKLLGGVKVSINNLIVDNSFLAKLKETKVTILNRSK